MKSTLDSTNIMCHVTLSRYITEWIRIQLVAGSKLNNITLTFFKTNLQNNTTCAL